MNKLKSIFVVVSLCATSLLSFSQGSGRAAWMQDAKFGVMTHYLVGSKLSAEEWNRRVDAFDVEKLADEVASTGAKYMIFTVGQNSGHYCSPNATYDKIVGISPSKCSRRDLIMDLSKALKKRDIRLIAYLPSGAPNADSVAIRQLEWNWGERCAEFQVKWESVIREWSDRWGDNIVGWWFDGCYLPNTMYRGEAPNFTTFAAAARHGNPNNIVAYNTGVNTPITTVSPDEDYISGEVNNPPSGWWIGIDDPIKLGTYDGAQCHVLTYLGDSWGGGSPRFSDAEALTHTRKVTDSRGAITWDVPITPEGVIPAEFITQLKIIGAGLKN